MSRRPTETLFAKLLDDVPFTDAELARAIGRSAATVYRWRHGENPPTWDDMQKVVDVVDARLVRIQDRLSRVRQACELYQQAHALSAGVDRGPDGGYLDRD